jgi:tRNA U34 5-methylaminomethyl-2-thiouridine-forming methyltransferase MnmC
MKLNIELTEDGSHTIFIPSLNERYHSYHGALQESLHIFIKNGFQYAITDKSLLHILEIGFGTGLNAILTYYCAEECQVRTIYTTIEPFPLNKMVYKNLNYPDLLGKEDAVPVFNKIHNSGWNKDISLSDWFIIHKINNKIEDILLPKEHFDLVYFDAFAPQVQPELWEKSIFQKIFNSLKPGACLLTYSAKGTVKRNLASAGFIIEGLGGPAGKREITRAFKTN